LTRHEPKKCTDVTKLLLECTHTHVSCTLLALALYMRSADGAAAALPAVSTPTQLAAGRTATASETGIGRPSRSAGALDLFLSENLATEVHRTARKAEAWSAGTEAHNTPRRPRGISPVAAASTAASAACRGAPAPITAESVRRHHRSEDDPPKRGGGGGRGRWRHRWGHSQRGGGRPAFLSGRWRRPRASH